MADESDEVKAKIQEAARRSRGYADFFQWPPDRDREEFGVVQELAASLDAIGAGFFRDPVSRGRPNDPPDCEAIDTSGSRIAIEVTELVDGEAIKAFLGSMREKMSSGQADSVPDWGVDWDLAKFEAAVGGLLAAKDRRHSELKGGPYPGGYVVVIYTDEAMLPPPVVEAFVKQARFYDIASITRAFIVISYDPEIERYPVVELSLMPSR